MRSLSYSDAASESQHDEPEDTAPQKLVPIDQIMKNFRCKNDPKYEQQNFNIFDFSRYLKSEAIDKSA